MHGQSCILGSFVDNIVAVSESVSGALHVLAIVERYLLQRWGLLIGGDSKEFIAPRGCEKPARIPAEFKQCVAMKTLGHILEENAICSACINNSVAAMFRSCYGNILHGRRRATHESKRKFLQGTLLSVARSRWARWTFTDLHAHTLDKAQRKLISVTWGLHPWPNETAPEFVLRRHMFSGEVARIHGLWSKHWAISVDSWAQHVARSPDEQSWTRGLLAWHDAEWVKGRRRLYNRGGLAYMHTRNHQGRPAARWGSDLETAREFAGIT